MSDYGDDYSDGGEEWFYVEEEYMVADDLAEHAVQSPPPTIYDEEMLQEWDRYDYFIDLEYASDGYDDAAFEPHKHDKNTPKIGQKRKRGTATARRRKRQRIANGESGFQDMSLLANSPVIWRSQAGRGAKPKLLAEDAKTYTLLKDWREKLTDIPSWTQQSPKSGSPGPSSKKGKAKSAILSEPMSPGFGPDGGEVEGAAIDPSALMAALQSRLAAAGGPLSGLNPQQLLQFAMRMANDESAGDDIAGEMADELFNQDEDEEEGDEEAEANLLSWVTAQRNNNRVDGGDTAMTTSPKSPGADRLSKRLPTSPASELTRSARVADKDARRPEKKDAPTATRNGRSEGRQASRKRKADDASDAESSTNAAKRRTTRSYDAPTAASQAKAAPTKASGSRRSKR